MLQEMNVMDRMAWVAAQLPCERSTLSVLGRTLT